MKKVVKSCCQGSHSECGVLVHVVDGRVVKIEGDPDHPMNKGYICPKGRNYHQFLYHPDRIKYPLKRMGSRSEGKWGRISWPEALDIIAAYSDPNRPPIPIQIGHLFRSNPAGHSDTNRPPSN